MAEDDLKRAGGDSVVLTGSPLLTMPRSIPYINAFRQQLFFIAEPRSSSFRSVEYDISKSSDGSLKFDFFASALSFLTAVNNSYFAFGHEAVGVMYPVAYITDKLRNIPGGSISGIDYESGVFF